MPKHPSHPRRQATPILALFALIPLTAAPAQSGDAKGSKDNPLIKRYEGSTIIGYDARKFDEFDLVLGPLQRDDKGDLTPTKSQRVEGQVTRILYTVPEGRSPLEVLQNYEQELQKNGFQTLYKCARDECAATTAAWASITSIRYETDCRTRRPRHGKAAGPSLRARADGG